MTRTARVILEVLAFVWPIAFAVLFLWRAIRPGEPLPGLGAIVLAFSAAALVGVAAFLVAVTRDSSISASSKAFWILAFLFTGPVGLWIYLLRRPGSPTPPT